MELNDKLQADPIVYPDCNLDVGLLCAKHDAKRSNVEELAGALKSSLNLTPNIRRRNLPTLGQQLRAASEKIHADELATVQSRSAALESKLQKIRNIVDEMDGQSPCSDETCICCPIFYKLTQQLLAILGEPGARNAEHVYTSTACHHNRHGECRRTCKFCDAQCSCGCHGTVGEPEVKNGEP